MGEFRMPSLGADMEEGVLVEWFVHEGDRVARGDVIAAVDTDKATIDVEVFETGVVERLLVEPGTTVPVGDPLAVIAAAADDGSASAPPTDGPPDEPAAATTGSDAGATDTARGPTDTAPGAVDVAVAVAADREPVSAGARVHHASRVLSPLVRSLADRLGVDPEGLRGTGPGGRITRSDVERAAKGPSGAPRGGPGGGTRRAAPHRASPRARRRATELGVDLGGVRGTGPGGRIVEADVLASTGPSAPSPTPGAATSDAAPPAATTGPVAAGGTDPADRSAAMRRAIARTMARSNREIPHYHLTQLVDLLPLTTWLGERNAGRPPNERVLPAAAVLRAVALSLRDVPALNGTWEEDGFRPGDRVSVAVAVSLRGGGLIAPVLHDTDAMGLDEVMSTMADVVTRARRGGLRASEMEGASITVTNLGDRGVDTVHGVVHPPQVALVGAGRIAPRPVVVDGSVVARPSVVLTLAADHRATDGQTGSRLLTRIEHLLRTPDEL